MRRRRPPTGAPLQLKPSDAMTHVAVMARAFASDLLRRYDACCVHGTGVAMRNTILVMLLAMVSVSTVWAEPWRLVEEFPNYRTYVDAGSVRPEGVYLSFAGRTIFQNGEEQLDGYIARCDARLVGMHTSFRYDSKGNNTSGFSVQLQEIRVFPVRTGTPLSAQVEYVCSGRAMSERNSVDSITEAQPNRNEERKEQSERSDDKKTAKASITIGSGVIVGTNGEILTNHHVVEGCSTISVKSDYG